MIREEFEVVVVGAGPAGLASAVTLGSYGVETLVVERRASSSTLPRATVASTATMELLRRWGLERKAWERSIDVEWQAWACATLADADHGQAVEVGLPTREQALLVSPTSPACLAQDELEPLLEEHLGSVGSVRLERGVELVALERASDGGHVLTLAGPDDAPPRPRQVRDRRRRRAQHACGRRSGSGPRATRTLRNASRSCSAARSGSSSASTATASTSSTERPQLPSRRQAGPLGVRDALGRRGRRRSTR